MIETDPIPGLFEKTRIEAPATIIERARSLAANYMVGGQPLPFALGDAVGPYEILGILGAGGQAVVYEARQVALDRRVAIKVPRKDVGDRLTREARLMAKLVHRSIVQVVDLSLDGPIPYLVLELCERGSLEDRLEIVSPDGLPLEQVFSVAVSILEALAFAHERGVVHRDVKPANVLFDANNNAKVADFGIGTISVSDDLAVSHDLSRLSLLAGTPLYLAPEQENPALREEGGIDWRADLFSFGKVLFQMLTGASPRTIRPPSRLRAGLGTAWDDFIFKLTEERPERRFQTALEALSALPEIRPAAAPPEPTTRATGSPLSAYRGETFPGLRLVGGDLDGHGFAHLFRAWHEGLGRDVLVRVLHPEQAANPRTVERFFREGRAAAAILHPNVVQVIDVGTTSAGVPFIVFEDVNGRTLEDMLRSGLRQSWESALRFVSDAAQALDAAHRAGIVHRDIKAECLIVTPEGRVKVADFGLARDLNSDLKLTADGAMIGTPLYMAPEIGRVKKLDGRVDIYSLGVVFYYLLTGVQPFRAQPAIEILSAKAHEKIEPPEKHAPIPADVRRVLGKMLEKDRDRRYRDMTELLRDLKALKSGEPVSAGEPLLWSGATAGARPRPPARPPTRSLSPKTRGARGASFSKLAAVILAIVSVGLFLFGLFFVRIH